MHWQNVSVQFILVISTFDRTTKRLLQMPFANTFVHIILAFWFVHIFFCLPSTLFRINLDCVLWCWIPSKFFDQNNRFVDFFLFLCVWHFTNSIEIDSAHNPCTSYLVIVFKGPPHNKINSQEKIRIVLRFPATVLSKTSMPQISQIPDPKNVQVAKVVVVFDFTKIFCSLCLEYVGEWEIDYRHRLNANEKWNGMNWNEWAPKLMFNCKL